VDLVVCGQSPGGRFGALPLLEIPDAELSQGFEVMLRGTWNVLKAVGPGMVARKKGTFVQCGTSSGVRTREGFAGLGAISSSVRALVQVAAKEWRPHGVHVAYLVIDGPIGTERAKAYGMPADKLLDPVEIARACEYLHGQSPRSWTHELLVRTATSEWTTPT
jgi:NAD(P)-dependent dehydrogenase (short-subunit alcohol dehydrogenase family)